MKSKKKLNLAIAITAIFTLCSFFFSFRATIQKRLQEAHYYGIYVHSSPIDAQNSGNMVFFT